MMRLQTKILLLLLAALVLSGVGLYMLQQALVLPSYLELEKIEAQKDALRCVETLRSEIDTLDVLLHDWSAWDDMYNFAKKPNESFVTSNLQSKTFTQNKWNLVYIFDQEDHLVWGRAMDLKTGRALSFPALDASPSRETGFLFGHRTINSVSKGVWLTPHGPMLTASRPIITSLFTPPIVGTAVMGRLLTDDYITKLAGKISVDFKIFPIPGGGKVKPSSHGSGPRG
ncbi:MAG: hypothetical protein GY765_37975, partial [bacterium]|nr:hypothetical protein [bacterium]